MADNIGDQFESNLSKLTEQVNKLVTALGSVTKDSTDALTQMKKQIQLCTDELKTMETATGGNNSALTGLRNQVNEATKKFNEIMSSESENGETLKDISRRADKSGEDIGNLLATEIAVLNEARNTAKGVDALADSVKENELNRKEELREAKKASKGGSTELNRDKSGGDKDEDEKDRTRGSEAGEKEKGILGTFRAIRSGLLVGLGSIAGFLVGFVGTTAEMFATFFIGLYKKIRAGVELFIEGVTVIGKGIGKLADGLFGKQSLLGEFGSFLMSKVKTGLNPVFESFAEFNATVVKGLKTKVFGFASEVGNFFKFIGSTIAKPFISFGKDIAEMASFVGGKFMGFFREVDSFVRFATKPLAGMAEKVFGTFKGIGTSLSAGAAEAKAGVSLFSKIGSQFSKIGTFLVGGEAGMSAFSSAYKTAANIGGKIASKLPFLSLIPTIIETFIAAFDAFKAGDFKGLLKIAIVGLLKGLAAFFTFGLSDFVIDFDKMLEALSKPLDGVITQLMGFVGIIKDVFMWLTDTLYQLWDGFLKPIVMSLWEDALKPLFNAVSALANFVFKIVAVILKLLTPVFALVKFVFKMVFEVVKVLWDWVIWPILSVLMPVFKFVFKLIGFVFDTIATGFGYMSDAFDLLLEALDDPINMITEFFDNATESFNYLGQVVADFLQPVVDMFSWIGGMISNVWETIKSKFQPLLSWLGIDLGPDTRSTRGMESSKEGMPAIASPSGAGSSEAAAAMTTAAPSTSAGQIRSGGAGKAPAAHATVVLNNAPTTNNVSNGGGGGSSAPLVISPNPIRHADPTRGMIAT